MSSPGNRRVRFGVEDIIINRDSPDPDRTATPSPTLTSSTIESPELASPVALPPFNFPFSTPASPCDFDRGALALDQCLQVPPKHQLPLFSYDMMRDPRGRFAVVPPLPEATLIKPALTPPQGKLTILVKCGLQWDIQIRAALPMADSSGSRPQRPLYVTIGDTLCAIYDDLQQRLRPEDLTVLSAEDQAKVEVAFRRRRDRMKAKKEKWDDATESKRRIDLLATSHRFVGLVFCPEDEKWVLQVEEHP